MFQRALLCVAYRFVSGCIIFILEIEEGALFETAVKPNCVNNFINGIIFTPLFVVAVVNVFFK